MKTLLSTIITATLITTANANTSIELSDIALAKKATITEMRKVYPSKNVHFAITAATLKEGIETSATAINDKGIKLETRLYTCQATSDKYSSPAFECERRYKDQVMKNSNGNPIGGIKGDWR